MATTSLKFLTGSTIIYLILIVSGQIHCTSSEEKIMGHSSTTPKLDLPDLITFIKWVGTINVTKVEIDGAAIVNARLKATRKEFKGAYLNILNDAENPFNATIQFEDYHKIQHANTWELTLAYTRLGDAWGTDIDTIENLLTIFIPKIQNLMPNMSIETIDFHNQLVDNVQTYLNAQELDQLQEQLNRTLIQLDDELEAFIQLIFPPSMRTAVKRNTTVTLEDILNFVEWSGTWNAEKIIYGLRDTLISLGEIRQEFKSKLYSILMEAGGSDLEHEGRIIVDGFFDYFDNSTHSYVSAIHRVWEPCDPDCDGLCCAMQAWASQMNLQSVLNNNFKLVPIEALSSIELLNELVSMMEPQYFQQVETLINDILGQADQVVGNYAQLWGKQQGANMMKLSDIEMDRLLIMTHIVLIILDYF